MSVASKQVRAQMAMTPAALPTLIERRSDFPNFWGLTQRQKQFVLEYCGGPYRFNVTASYGAAGYEIRGMGRRSAAYAVWRRPRVMAAIKEVMAVGGLTPEFVAQKIGQQVQGVDLADMQPFLDGEKTLAELAEEGVNTAALAGATIKRGARGQESRSVQTASVPQILRLAAEVTGMVTRREVVEHHHTLDVRNMPAQDLARLEHALGKSLGPADAASAVQDVQYAVREPSADEGAAEKISEAGGADCAGGARSPGGGVGAEVSGDGGGGEAAAVAASAVGAGET